MALDVENHILQYQLACVDVAQVLDKICYAVKKLTTRVQYVFYFCDCTKLRGKVGRVSEPQVPSLCNNFYS